jgi:hypothetical protein
VRSCVRAFIRSLVRSFVRGIDSRRSMERLCMNRFGYWPRDRLLETGAGGVGGRGQGQGACQGRRQWRGRRRRLRTPCLGFTAWGDAGPVMIGLSQPITMGMLGTSLSKTCGILPRRMPSACKRTLRSATTRLGMLAARSHATWHSRARHPTRTSDIQLACRASHPQGAHATLKSRVKLACHSSLVSREVDF